MNENHLNLDRNTSFGEKGLPIIKTNDFQIISGLDNGARVSPYGENGVSQVPALPSAMTADGSASEQPSKAVLQAALTEESMLSLQGNDIRMQLMETVRRVRQALGTSSDAGGRSNASYIANAGRIIGHITEIISRESNRSKFNSIEKINDLQAAYLGAYADKPNSFFAYRRSLEYWWRKDLSDILKRQDSIQKELRKSTDEKFLKEVFTELKLITSELNKKLKIIENISLFDRDYCFEKFTEHKDFILNKVKKADCDSSLILVSALNKRMPNWQDKFREHNNSSFSKYKSHAFIQSLTGIRPVEFESSRENGNLSTGVQIKLLCRNKISVRVLGAKVNKNSGQPIREFEIETDLPNWFMSELMAEGGQKILTAKTQALRDHYSRISEQIFKGQRYGKSKKMLRITPYCFRHAVASNMRHEGWSAEEIAACLGHSSAETPRHYGMRRGGKKNPKHGCQTVVVKASLAVSRPIKPSGNDWSIVSEQFTGTTKKTGAKKRPQG